MFGAIEAGGTKFVCGVGTGPEDLTTIQFPTTSPDTTLTQAIEFLRKESAGELQAVGIGSFGPIDLHSTSLTFGYVTSTPKVGWQNYNLAGTLGEGGPGLAPRSPGVDIGRALSGAWAGELGPHPVASAHCPWRRRRAPIAAFQTHSPGHGNTAKRLCSGS